MLRSSSISREDCEALLRSTSVGRVAVSTPSGPRIVPVGYLAVEGAILFRVTPYSVLETYGHDALLAFEVDDFQKDHLGWSVAAQGRGRVVTDPEELQRIRVAWPTSDSSGTQRDLVFRLPTTMLNGSRVSRPSVD